ELADLEAVVALAAVDRRQGAVVVGGELVVAVVTKDDQAAVDAGVVVDAFNDVGLGVGVVVDQQGDEVLPQKEAVVLLGTVDGHRVHAVVGGTGVMDVDEVLVGSNKEDPISICTALAVQVDGVTDQAAGAGAVAIVGGCQRVQTIDDEEVVTIASEDA